MLNVTIDEKNEKNELSDQNLAMFEAVEAVGGQLRLGALMKKNQSTINYWLKKKVKPGQKIVKELDDAYLMEEVSGLPGLALRIYPPLKKFAQYHQFAQ